MKKTISVVALASILAAGTAYASGYRIPEQSADSTAKAGANIAGALGADAAYFNPANMSWMDNEGWTVEGDLSYIYLSAIEYEDNRSAFFDDESKDENFLLPTFFAVSPDYNGFHFGFSLTAPYGLAKRWPDGYGGTFAEKFDLKVFDINPSLSYRFNDWISFAAGARILYSEATVMSNGAVAMGPFGPITASRYMDGDALDYGWNAALSVKPTVESNISVTYRSKVDLDFDGDVLLNTNAFFYPGASVVTDGDVTIPAPATLAVSGSYDFGTVKVEFAIDRTFWSDYEDLDFAYDTAIANPVLFRAFDAPKRKNWDDVNAYRLGIDYRLNPDLTIMAGFAYDENPVPDETIGFDLPDSDAYIVSLGARYKLSENSQIAGAILYDYKESRDVRNENVDGEFTNASAVFVTLGYSYTF